jgi:hypothetical protein
VQDDTSGRSQDPPESPRPSDLPKIDTEIPHSARIWNYWLGGTDNYEVDRAAGDQYVAVYPEIRELARGGRYFLARALRYLVAEAGIRQFLDIGTGLPTVDNTHEVAQRLAPETRVVYVDNDPLVLAHARALLTSTPEGATTYLDADLHQPEKILERAGASLDLSRPLGLMLIGVMGHIVDDAEARSIVRRLVDALPPGSYLTLYDATDKDAAFNQAQSGYDDTGAVPYVLRTPEFVTGYFDGLEPVEPGIVPARHWRPEIGSLDDKDDPTLCAVARKP